MPQVNNVLLYEIYINSTFELNLLTRNHGQCKYLTAILNVSCLQKDSEMNITMHKALLERFHSNGNTIGSYPQTHIFVFS